MFAVFLTSCSIRKVAMNIFVELTLSKTFNSFPLFNALEIIYCVVYGPNIFFKSVKFFFLEHFSPRPKVTLAEYDTIIYALGGAHNFFSFLVLITYFLSNHPTLPKFSSIGTKIRYVCVTIIPDILITKN